MPINKKQLSLIIAVASGLIAVILINLLIKQKITETERRVAQAKQNLVSVIIATKDIPAGVAIKESMLKEETVHKGMLQPRAATSMDRVVDRITLAPISKGEQILLNKITLAGGETSLAMKVPIGKRAVTIPIDNITSVGGMIKPGDHVDVVGMIPIPAMTQEGKQVTQMSPLTLFQDVVVLAVGQEISPVPSAKKEEKAVSPTITFALTPQEANLLTFVQEQSKIRLVLRSPGDTQVQPAFILSWDTLFKMVMPQLVAERPPEAPKKTVEIYHGLQKEIKPLE